MRSNMASLLVLGGFCLPLLIPTLAFSHSFQTKQAFIDPPQTSGQKRLLNDFDDGQSRIVRSVVDSFKIWPAGQELKVCFFDGTAAIRAFFADASTAWTENSNLKFNFGAGPNFRNCGGQEKSHLRITFASGGNWSYIGTDSIAVAQSSPSMQIGYASQAEFELLSKTRLRGVILHELGHALGLEHEHQSPEANCEAELDWDKLYGSLGWNKVEVDRNFRQIFASPRFSASPYDPRSIMHYQLPGWMFKQNASQSCLGQENSDLSVQDKNWIRQLYPVDKDQQKEQLQALGSKALQLLNEANIDNSELKKIIDYIKTISPDGFELKITNIGNIEGDNINTGNKSPVIKGVDTKGGSIGVDIK